VSDQLRSSPGRCFDATGRPHVWLLVLFAVALVAAACGRPQTPVPATSPSPTAAPASSDDEDALKQLLNAEAEAVVAQDIDLLMQIWADDGVVADARHTPQDPKDDARWEGKDAIRERYVTLVFPAGPQTVAHPTVNVAITGDTAVLTTTTQIGTEVAPSGDRWTLARTADGWKIKSLTYNLEPK
jgi:ketosteroid isomerase-like protein